MSKQANPTLIGAFVFGALALATITVFLLAGEELFQDRSQHIMCFADAQGLQVGAPVVFLGVKIGTVKDIQVSRNQENKGFMVQVTVELDLQTVQTDSGNSAKPEDRLAVRELVEQGLRARLKTQSLLTGQRFIDLGFYPGKPARFISDDPKAKEIPTIPTAVEELTGMLEDFPTSQFLENLANIGASTSKLLSSPEMQDIPVRLEATLSHLESLTAQLNSRGGPFLTEAKASFKQLNDAVTAVQAAMGKVGKAADQVEKSAGADSGISSSIELAATELAKAAQVLQELGGNDSRVMEQLTESLHEISRAAQAFRLLAQSLEQQPEAILRGKNTKENY